MNLLLKLRNGVLYILAWLAKPLYIAYIKTLRIDSYNEKYYPQNLDASNNAIFVSWHSGTFYVIPFCRNLNIGELTLLDWRNVFWEYLTRFLGYDTIPVSDNKQATIRLLNILKQGRHIVLAVDGPHGPAGVIKPGAIFIAKKSKKPIIVARVEFEKKFRLNHRWDRYQIPFPFSKTKTSVSDPIYVDGQDPKDVEAQLLKALGPC